MKAITTKFYGATATKPARIIATDADRNTATVIDNECKSDPHEAAALKLCKKMRWSGAMAKGGVKGAQVFVFLDNVVSPDAFVLQIELGNAAMRTGGDIAHALRATADKLERARKIDDGKIRDHNGNTVGSWRLR